MGSHRRLLVGFGLSAFVALASTLSACGGEKSREKGGGEVSSALSAPVKPLAQELDKAQWVLVDAPQEFSGQASVALEDGSVLITGGWLVDPKDFSDKTTDSVYVFQPEKGAWETRAPMGQGRHLHYAARLEDGRVLVTGGEFYVFDEKEPTHELLTTTEIFDPKDRKWMKAPDMGFHTFYAPVVRLPDGPVLFLGGETIEDGQNTPTDRVQVFSREKETGSWGEATKLPGRFDGHTATLLPDGSVFLAGGYEGGKPGTGTFVLMKDRWIARPPLLTPRSHHTATVLADGSVLIVGGTADFEDGSTEIHHPLEEGKPPTKAAPIAIPRMQHTAALLPDGRVIIVGGWGFNGELTSTEIYDPKENAWTPGPELHMGRRNHEMVMAAGRLVVVGDYLPKQYGKGYLEVLEVGADLGESCTDGSQCMSGSCVDGVCCDSPCEGACMACSAALTEKGQSGICAPARAGTNPRGACFNQGASSCGTTGVCNGNGACGVYPNGTSCGIDRECQGGQCLRIPTVCTGQADGTACGSGMICESGECVTAPPCWGQADGAECGSGMICEGGECVTAPPCWGQADGAECGSGMICEGGQCVTAPPCWGQADGAECRSGMICEGGECVSAPTDCTKQGDGTVCGEGDGCTIGLCRGGECVEIHKLDGTRCEGGTCIAGECRLDRVATPPPSDSGSSDGGVGSDDDSGSPEGASSEGEGEDETGGCSLSPAPSKSSPLAMGFALLTGLGLVRRSARASMKSRRS